MISGKSKKGPWHDTVSGSEDCTIWVWDVHTGAAYGGPGGGKIQVIKTYKSQSQGANVFKTLRLTKIGFLVNLTCTKPLKARYALIAHKRLNSGYSDAS